MTQNSKIEWTDHTFNPWIGCTKVSPGCDNCYAEVVAKRFNMAEWGSAKTRKLTSDKNWSEPLRWNKEAEKLGIRQRVFCASLADIFDNEVNPQWRQRLWKLISETQNLDWLILTKRIGNAKTMWPAPIDGTPLSNVWLGISVVNQEEANRDISKLLETPARVRFLSIEPLLGAVSLRWLPAWPENAPAIAQSPSGITNHLDGLRKLDWVIVGGESGAKARPMHPQWARTLRDQCIEAGVPFFFKQWGEWQITYDRDHDDPDWRNCPRPKNNSERYINIEGGHGFHGQQVCFARKVGKKTAGRLLDGREWNQYPSVNVLNKE